MQETTALLQRAKVKDPDQVIEGVVWKRIRKFRVSVTGSHEHSSDLAFCKLFKGYDTVVPGTDATKRQAEVLCFDDLRAWMSQFAKRVRNAVNAEKEEGYV